MRDFDDLYVRALDILEGKRHGHALPILRKLAVRRYTPALNLLTDFEPCRSLQLQRRAAMTGDPISLYNLAIEHLNQGDLAGYRHWLARAGRTYSDARYELRAFRTRFPHENMRSFRRLCPAAR